MWINAIQAHSRLVNAYASLLRATTASVTSTLQNSERLQRRQLDLLRETMEQNARLVDQAWTPAEMSEYVAAQSRLVADTTAQGMELWRAFFGAVQGAQGAALSAASAAEHAWSGQERRKTVITPYSGEERRKAA